MNGVVLTLPVYIDDGWYGDRYRYILSLDKQGGFKNKTQANKYSAKLRKYVKLRKKIKPKDLVTQVGPLEDFPQYTHISMGPSIYYTHIHLTVEELVDCINQH